VRKLPELESFIRVVQAGTFTAAALELGLTPSAVSKQVRGLEERLGLRLLNRTTRSVSLTEAGRAFFERVAPLLAEIAEAEEAVSELQAELRGEVRVSAPMDFGVTHLAAAFARFTNRNPHVDLHIELSDRFVDVIRDGFDLAIRIGETKDSGLIARRLGPCRRVLCASPDYLERNGTPREPSELRKHQRVGYAYETERSFAVSGVAASSVPKGRITMPIVHHSNNSQLTRQLILEGQGFALLPTFLVAEDIAAGRLEVVLPDRVGDVIPIQALYPHRKYLSAKVRALVDHLVGHCGDAPYWDAELSLNANSTR